MDLGPKNISLRRSSVRTPVLLRYANADRCEETNKNYHINLNSHLCSAFTLHVLLCTTYGSVRWLYLILFTE